MIDPYLAIKMVYESPIIAYDTETNGLDIHSIPVGYVVTDTEHSVYVPVRHEGGGNIPDGEEFEKELALAFSERSRLGYLTVGHHLHFDMRMSAKKGILLNSPLEDTQINMGLINNTTIGYGLDDCSKRYQVTLKSGADLYVEIASRFGGTPDKTSMQHFAKMPGDHPLVVEYATTDGVATLQVWQKQQEDIENLGLEKIHRLECDIIPYVDKVHRNGIKVDMKYGEKLMDPKVDGGITKSIQEFLKEFPPGFNANSPKDVERLFRSEGFTDFNLTPSGKPSFTMDWLMGNPIGERVISLRQMIKAQTSFVEPLIKTYNINGRVHAILNQSKSDEYGTNSGRFSCSEPNLQAYPKRNKKIGSLVRPLLIPDEGMEIEEDDFSQQEPRLFGHYSEDPALCEGYLSNPPRDIHTTAANLTGRPRDDAKRIGLGILTGLSKKGLAQKMGWSFQEAARAHDEFLKDAFPNISDFQSTAKTKAEREGFVRSIWGRLHFYPDKRFAYKAVSGIIQGSGATHMKLAFLRSCQYCDSVGWDKVSILMTIHDSFINQHKIGFDTYELRRILLNVSHELELLIPIPVEGGIGSNWAEASYTKNKTVMRIDGTEHRG